MPRMNKPKYSQPIVLALVLFSFLMSALVSRTVFERLPHLEDEVAYLFQAKMAVHGDLVIETPTPRRAFWQPFIIDRDGLRFGKYPPGWPVLLGLGVAMGQAWVINAFFAGLTVALVYRMGREVFDEDTGVLAAALTAFSPMALLLNATMMGHTVALFFTTLFLYAYWRIERGKHAFRWGLAAGFSLGMMAIMRPLTAIGIAVPFVLWSVYRLLRRLLSGGPRPFLAVLRPLVALMLVAMLITAAIPVHSYMATGDPTLNLYTLVWSYDRVGFGECCGRNGHTLEKGIRQTRFDLSLMAADLFGWQLGTFTPEIEQHLENEADYYPLIGLSWILLPFGLLMGIRRRWTWLLAGATLALIGVHMAYWIGSQRYSTRYYFEALTALTLLSALPLGWLARRGLRLFVYGVLGAALIYSLYAYSTPRISVLYRFNRVGQDLIAQVEARREGDRPVLVVVNGTDVRWRAYGSLMAVTSPYLDSDIVAAWNYGDDTVREQIIAQFPDRQVIEMSANGNASMFMDSVPAAQG